MYRKFIIIFLIAIIFMPGVIFSNDDFDNEYFETIYYGEDPAGDDYGPGAYRYPGHRVFQPGEGHFDLKSFEIQAFNSEYRLIFEFGEIENPWDGKYGFSHQLIHMYFDTDSEIGQSELFRPGARVKLNPDFPWDYHLQFSGWWLRLMDTEDDPDDLVRDILNVDAEISPWDVYDINVEVLDSKIILELPEEYLGDIQGSKFYLLVGGFDPFGEDNFRPVQNYRTNWSFYYDQDLDESNNFVKEEATRVIDYFYPEPGYQEEFLGVNFDEISYLKPIKIPLPEKTFIELIRDYSYLIAFIYSIISFFIISYILYFIIRSASDE